jgi:hypothetical protein
MSFADRLKKLDAQRLQMTAKATVQNNGRLSFSVEAVKLMHLDEEKSIIIFSADNGDLGATISTKVDPDAFALKKAGVYYYVAFRVYLQQMGIDYKNQRIVYEITELDEKLEGRTLYKMERRVLPKDPTELEISDPTEDEEETAQDASTPQEGSIPMPTPSEADTAPSEPPAPPIPPAPPPQTDSVTVESVHMPTAETTPAEA